MIVYEITRITELNLGCLSKGDGFQAATTKLKDTTI